MVLPKAWFALVRLRPDMNLLMTIAVLGATAIGEWFEAATVGFLFSCFHLRSRIVERFSGASCRCCFDGTSPPTARLQETQQEVPAESVAVGTVISVRPGERIPLDGRVVAGQSHVNQAPITGESVPVSKSVDEEVFAGTINGDGALQIRTTKAAKRNDTCQYHSNGGRSSITSGPIGAMGGDVCPYYTPLVMVLAVWFLSYRRSHLAECGTTGSTTPWCSWLLPVPGAGDLDTRLYRRSPRGCCTARRAREGRNLH